MTSPEGNVRPSMLRLEDKIRQLESRLDALTSRGLREAGEFFARTPDGVKTFSTGPIPGLAPMPDGSPQWMTFIRDTEGNARWALWDPDTTAQGYQQALWEWDHLGNIIRTTDINGGWAEPHLAFQMHPMFAMAAGVFTYMHTTVNVAEQILWEGKIPYVTHPSVKISGIWGQALGGPNTTRYRLKINGVTVGTWDVGAIEASTKVFSIVPSAAFITMQNPSAILTAQSLSGSGSYACQVLSSAQRQT